MACYQTMTSREKEGWGGGGGGREGGEGGREGNEGMRANYIIEGGLVSC